MAYTAIDDPSAHFQTLLYTGNGSSQTMTNDGNSDLQPDFLWIKQRSGTENHYLGNSSLANKFLNSDRADTESTNAGGKELTYNSDGFAFAGSDSTWNGSSSTYVAWQWKANGGTRTTNTESGNDPGGGYQANTTAGFSIIDYTGTGSAGTMAHGLGAVPAVMIIKGRDIAGNWRVYHHKIASDPETDAIKLDETAAVLDSAGFWNDTAPTSSVFSLGDNDNTNEDGNTYIAYLWKEIQGYSKFGSYTGNGNVDGAFVYTGFKPAWVMIKATDVDEWRIYDHKRANAFNVINVRLKAHSNAAESQDDNECDFLSNGVKIRSSSGGVGSDGQAYIYMAFAEQPFVTSDDGGSIPCTAR